MDKAFKAILILSAVDRMSNVVSGAMSKSMRSLDSFGQRQQQFGQSMLGGSAMIAAPLIGATKAAMDFETAFTGVVKTWRGSMPQLEHTRKGIIAMSREIPESAENLSAIAEAAGQLGIESENVLKFTRTIADLKATTNLGDEAAPQFAKFANITRMPQTQMDRLGSTVVHLGNNLATTEADIVNFGMRIAGAGAQVDIPQAKIMGLAAGLSSVGLEAEAGGTAISKTLIELSNRVKSGGRDLDQVAKIAGMSGGAFAEAFASDAANATVTFIEGLGRIKDEGGNVFAVIEQLGMGEVRLRDTLLRASGAGDLLRKSINLSSEGWENNNALTKEAATRYATSASRMKIFKNNVTALGITVGNVLIPHLTKMVEWLSGVITSVTELSERYPVLTKFVVAGAAGLAAFMAVAGSLAYVVGTVSRGIAAASTVMGLFGKTTKIITALQWLWNAAMLANPIGLIVAGVAAAIAAVTAMVIYWDDLVAAFKNANPVIKILAVSILYPLAPLIAVAGAIRFLIDNWDDLPGAIGRAVDSALSYVGEIWTGIKNVVGKVVNYLAMLPVRMFMHGVAMVQGVWNGIKSFASTLWDGVTGIFDTVMTKIGEFPAKAFEAGKKIISSVVDGMKAVAMAPVNFVAGVVSDIRDYLPFSPAKKGALTDIHRVRLIETVAEGMKPAPMVKAMQVATKATSDVLNPTGATKPIEFGRTAQASVNSTTNTASNPVTVNFSPVVNVTGAGNAQDIRAEIMKMAPELMRMIDAAMARRSQVSFEG